MSEEAAIRTPAEEVRYFKATRVQKVATNRWLRALGTDPQGSLR